MSNPTEYVQPIMLLIDKSDPASHLDAIRAVATASVRVYNRDLIFKEALPVWDEWLSGPFAKSVRRADNATYKKVLDLIDPNDTYTIKIGLAEVTAFRPVRASEMPKPLKRLQVTGTELPDSGFTHSSMGPTIYLDAGLQMTTGKAAAQAAHAMFLWYLGQEPGTALINCNIVELASEEFVDRLQSSGSRYVIQDAGRTEIEPGSTTAFAVDMPSTHVRAPRAAHVPS